MKIDRVTRKKKVSYKESWEDDSEEYDESLEDIEHKRNINKKKKNSEISEENYDDDEFEPEEESSQLNEELEDLDVDSVEVKEDKILGKKRKGNENSEKKTKEKVPKVKTEKKPKEKKEKVPKEKKPKEKKEKVPKDALDLTYNIEENYFYQNLKKEEFSQIEIFFENYFKNINTYNKTSEFSEVNNFLLKFPNIKKGEENVNQIKKM